MIGVPIGGWRVAVTDLLSQSAPAATATRLILRKFESEIHRRGGTPCDGRSGANSTHSALAEPPMATMGGNAF